jgi:hypothetical protein
MQHYLDHVRRSRSRLEKVVAKKLSKPKTSVLIRGTALRDPSVESFIKSLKREGEKAVPFYAGTLGFFEPSAGAKLLDASLRKSISFALAHFHDGIHTSIGDAELFKSLNEIRTSRGDTKLYESLQNVHTFLFWLSNNGNLENAMQPVLSLILIQGYDFSHLHSKYRSRCAYQFSYVGNETVPTLIEQDWRPSQLEDISQNNDLLKSSLVVSLPARMLSEFAALAIKKEAIEETSRFINRRNKNQHLLSNHGAFSIEGFKQPIGFGCVISPYRFSIEVEIAIMERMLDALDNP